MANLDHDAIRRAYPSVTIIDDATGAFAASGNSVTLVQSDIDAARTVLDSEAAAVRYKEERTNPRLSDTTYPPIGDSLDLIYWDQVNGTTKFRETIAAVKAAHPKPS